MQTLARSSLPLVGLTKSFVILGFEYIKYDSSNLLLYHVNKSFVLAVWKELEKENREFFEAYSESRDKNDGILAEEETRELIQRMMSKDDIDHD